MEAHGNGIEAWYDWAKQQMMMQTDRPTALRQVFQACRKGGTVSIPGVYGGVIDKVPIGAAFNKGLTLRMGQTHVQRYMNPLLQRIEKGEIDPSYIISHRISLDEAPDAYKMFRNKEDNCIKFVLRP
jgi:threonine dehydrogenase-like Zn-dependent dehydrogenase